MVPIETGKDMGDMLASGELVAAIGVEIDHPDVKPLIPNALEAGLEALRERRPLSDQPHRRDQGRADRASIPTSPPTCSTLSPKSKRLYLERLKAGQIEKPTEVDKVHQRVMEITGDPLPYGVAPNRKVIEELIRHALTQGIITKPVSVDELFAPSTRGLVG